MSDFARVMEIAMAAKPDQTKLSLGEVEPEDAKDAKDRPAARPAEPAQAAKPR